MAKDKVRGEYVPIGLEATDVWLGGERLVVLNYSLAPAPAPSLLSKLRPSQREVARLLLAGCSNAEIARARRTARGTVAKQIDGIYRSLGVRSRGELVAAFCGRRG
jgi:DNA-binding NarL/FixJ family response regulator